MLDAEGFILAGGASSRMGSDKARLLLGGRTFMERAAAALHEFTSEVSIVSARPWSGGIDLPLVQDVYRDCGALGGLHAALRACRAPWAAVVSCDLPFVTGKLFKRLGELRAEDVDAIAPRQADGRAQPLCAIYSPASCLKLVERLLEAGERRPRVLLQETRTRWVAPAELADLAGAERFFLNVNTPADYARAKAQAD